MKRIILFLAGLTAAFALASCTSDIEKTQISGSATAPQLENIASINITADNLATGTCTFQWKSADFGAPTAIVYTLIAAYGGKTSVLFDNLTGVSYQAGYAELSPKLTDLGVPSGVDAKVDFHLSCTIGSTYRSIESNTVSTTVHID